MKSKSGFTLLELLIVMAIIAMLVLTGFGALSQFVATVEIVENGKQSVQILDLIRNAAKNDVRPPRDASNTEFFVYFKGYRYNFDTNTTQYCFDSTEFGAVSGNTWNCNTNASITQNLTTFELPLIKGSEPVNIGLCGSIYFESLTGDIYVSLADDPTSTPYTTRDCYYPFRDTYSRYNWYLYVDGVIDDVTIYKDFNEVIQATGRF